MKKVFFIYCIQLLNEGIYRIFNFCKRGKMRVRKNYGRGNVPDRHLRLMSEIILSYVRYTALLFGQYQNRYKIFYYRIYEMMEREMMDGEGKSILCEIINRYFGGIADKLQRKHPDLKKEEVELLCLLAAGFTSMELVVIYRLENIESVYVKCSRLKKRMNLNCPLNIYLQKYVPRSINLDTVYSFQKMFEEL